MYVLRFMLWCRLYIYSVQAQVEANDVFLMHFYATFGGVGLPPGRIWKDHGPAYKIKNNSIRQIIAGHLSSCGHSIRPVSTENYKARHQGRVV